MIARLADPVVGPLTSAAVAMVSEHRVYAWVWAILAVGMVLGSLLVLLIRWAWNVEGVDRGAR